MSANFIFQPKPEGDRHVQVHISYKRITDGKESTAALLSVLEYLAKQSLLNSGTWSIGDPIPVHIPICGDCNAPRLNRLLDDWLKPTALRSKLQQLEALGFISIDTSTNHRRRFVTYHYGAIAAVLSQINLHPPKPDPSKSEASLSEVLKPTAPKPADLKPDSSKNGASDLKPLENVSLSDPSKSVGSKKCGLTPQKVDPYSSKSEVLTGLRPQKVDPSRSLDPDLLADQKEDPSDLPFLPGQEHHQDYSADSGVLPVNAEGVEDLSLSQSEFELLSSAQQQSARLQNVAISLDPWIIDEGVNRSNVLSGRVFRCGFDAGFTEYLWKQLCQSPYWQKRSDAPPTNAGIRIIKDLYAIVDPAGRDAERERLMGEWDKYQRANTQQQQNKQLRASSCTSNSCSSSKACESHSSEVNYVPFSQAPLDVQQSLARFRRKSSLSSFSESVESVSGLSAIKTSKS